MTKVHHFENQHQLWIAHTPALHFGKAGDSKLISTGQQHLEIYDNEQEWATRVIELGGQPYEEDMAVEFSDIELANQEIYDSNI